MDLEKSSLYELLDKIFIKKEKNIIRYKEIKLLFTDLFDIFDGKDYIRFQEKLVLPFFSNKPMASTKAFNF